MADRPAASRAWFACAILSLGYLLAFADRTVVALLVVPIEHDLGLTDIQLSLIQGTAFAVFYALFGLPVAWAVDRLHRGRIVAAGIAIWSAMTALAGLAGGFGSFFLARVGVGAGEATILPGATSLFADLFPPALRGRVLGIFASGIYLGSALALIGGGLVLRALHGDVLVLTGLGALHPWRVVLLLAAAPGVPLAVAALALREPARRHRASAAPAPSFPAAFRAGGAALAAHIVAFTALAFASYAATAWLPTLLIRVHHWTPAQVGTRLGLEVLLVGPAGSIAGGVLADLLERRRRSDGKFLVTALAAAGTVPSALLAGLAPGAAGAFAGAGLVIFFTSFVWGLAPAALAEIVHGAALGRVTAVYTAILNLIGLGLGPTSVALVARFLFPGPTGLAPAVAVVVPIAALISLAACLAGRRAYRTVRLRLVPGEPR